MSSTKKTEWERPKTSRVYLQAPGAESICLLFPDFKLTDLALCDNGRHTRQDAFGVHLLFGKDDPDAVDFRKTVFAEVKGGFPVYTVKNKDKENGCGLTFTAFSSCDRIPVTYGRITVKNTGKETKEGRIGLLPRAVKDGDQYLTGLWDTGYESYAPNVRQWYMQRVRRVTPTSESEAAGADGYGRMKIISSVGFDVRFISRYEQKKRFLAQDYFACDYTLLSGEEKHIDFALCASQTENFESFDTALSANTKFWSEIIKKIKVFPKTEDKLISDIYKHNITQCLQMLARYDGKDAICTRQGDVGRFIWVWEAVRILIALDKTGFSDYTSEAYKTFCSWVAKDGENKGGITYRFVRWNNAEGALLLGLGEHLKTTEDLDEYGEIKDTMRLLSDYIERMRHLEEESGYPGLFPVGKSSDWGEHGKHWVYTDAFHLLGLKAYAEALDKFSDPFAKEAWKRYCDYRKCVLYTMEKLYRGHENDESFILPHIAGVDFEDSYNHCFYTDGAPLLCGYGIMDPKSKIFAQMENFYNENGLFEHDLAGRMTNAADPGLGAYGDTYYTGLGEIAWIIPWMQRGDNEKADRMHAALLKYNLTKEHIVSERYCSADPYYTPWQPNGSGSGRIVLYLLMRYGTKK